MFYNLQKPENKVSTSYTIDTSRYIHCNIYRLNTVKILFLTNRGLQWSKKCASLNSLTAFFCNSRTLSTCDGWPHSKIP